MSLCGSTLASDQRGYIQTVIGTLGIKVDTGLSYQQQIINIDHIDTNYFGPIVIVRGQFRSFDSTYIPVWKLYPANYQANSRYYTIIVFSGHGSANELLYDSLSYQRAGALRLAQNGYMVYVMENRGMGHLSSLGDHSLIDNYLRKKNSSWYGYIITDALHLVSLVHQSDDTDTTRIGVAGVSTGGALSMITASIDERIHAACIMGWLSDFNKAFCSDSHHHSCGDIFCSLDVEKVGATIVPRDVLYINGVGDSFYPWDAEQAFFKIRPHYEEQGAQDNLRFESPSYTWHEFHPLLASDFFLEAYDPSKPRVTSISMNGEVNTKRVVNHSPSFSFSTSTIHGGNCEKVYIQVSTNLYFQYSDLWNLEDYSITSSTVVYNGRPLINGREYYARIKVRDEHQFSNWRSISFRMNATPVPTQLLSLTEYESNSYLLRVKPSEDPDNDAVSLTMYLYLDTTKTAVYDTIYIPNAIDTVNWYVEMVTCPPKADPI